MNILFWLYSSKWYTNTNKRCFNNTSIKRHSYYQRDICTVHHDKLLKVGSNLILQWQDTCLSLKLSCCDMSSFDSGVRNCCTMFRGFRSASWCKICNTNHLVRLQVLTVMAMKTAAFCDVMWYTLVVIYWCFSQKKIKVNLSVLDHEDLKGE